MSRRHHQFPDVRGTTDLCKSPTRHDQREVLPRSGQCDMSSFLRPHFADKPMLESRNVGCFLSYLIKDNFIPNILLISGQMLEFNYIQSQKYTGYQNCQKALGNESLFELLGNFRNRDSTVLTIMLGSPFRSFVKFHPIFVRPIFSTRISSLQGVFTTDASFSSTWTLTIISSSKLASYV